ncbi:Hypothetical protein DHA2_8658 [Giardia duodenalis]|uniref:Uncharacterized protein n=1 Tax=Giardia intestinalis TaxID=5741 RepID=V6T8Y6_GIAIN|nr:Hypothetical protein DHA2_8658 [Giardia intestinalis]
MKCRRFYTLRYRNCLAGLGGVLVGALVFGTYRIPFDDLERFTRCTRGSYVAENPGACPYPGSGSASIFFYVQILWIGAFGLLGILLTLFTPTFRHTHTIVWCEHFTKFSINTAIGCLVHLLFVFPFISITPENEEAYNALRTFVVYGYFIWYIYILAYGLLLFMSIFVLDYLEADQVAANNRAVAREDAITSYQKFFTESLPPTAPPNGDMSERVHQIHIKVVGESDHRQVPPGYSTKNFLNKSYKMRYIGLVLTTSFFVYGICVGVGYGKAAPECFWHLSGKTTFQCVPVASWIYGAVYGLVWSGTFYATVCSRAIPKVGLFGKRSLSVD